MMTVMMEGARPPMAPPTGCAPIISTGNLPKIADELPETEGKRFQLHLGYNYINTAVYLVRDCAQSILKILLGHQEKVGIWLPYRDGGFYNRFL